MADPGWGIWGMLFNFFQQGAPPPLFPNSGSAPASYIHVSRQLQGSHLSLYTQNMSLRMTKESVILQERVY